MNRTVRAIRILILLSPLLLATPACPQTGDARARELVENARKLHDMGLYSISTGDHDRAERLLHEALEIVRGTLGENDWRTATVLDSLGALHRAKGDPEHAESLLLKSLAVKRRAGNPPETARTLDNLAVVYLDMGDFASAKPLFKESLEIKEKLLGDDPETARTLNNQAGLYHELGDVTQAASLYRRSLEMMKRLSLGQHPNITATLDNLGDLHRVAGDYLEAERAFRQSLEIRQRALQPDHPDVAVSLNNLATLYTDMGEHDRAVTLLRQSLEIRERRNEHEHPATAATLANLAEVHRSMGEHALAVPLHLQALEIQRKTFGEEHPSTATTLNNLALAYHLMGRLDDALPLYQQSLEIRRSTLGEVHPDTTVSRSNLALLHVYLGHHGLAESLLRESLPIVRKNLDVAATVQSERQQLWMAAKLRSELDTWLMLAPKLGVADADQYAELTKWKGAVFAAQALVRSELENPETARLFDEWSRIGREVATLTWGRPKPGEPAARLRRLAELGDRMEKLERELATASASFRRQRAPVSSTDIQRALPERTALVDLLVYTHVDLERSEKENGPRVRVGEPEERLVGFVLRRDRGVKRVDLGPIAAIDDALASWRQALHERTVHAGSDSAVELGRLLWTPLKPHLRDVDTVLVSPDRTSSVVPWAALPGSRPETYLIEDVGIAVVPAPRELPRWLEADRNPPTSLNGPPALLLVGGVDYGESSGSAKFKPLEHTLAEIDRVQKLFKKRYPSGNVVRLTAGGATESAFREQAPAYGWLHLATHGFYSPDDVPSIAEVQSDSLFASWLAREGGTRFDPGLSSGVALTGANAPPRTGDDDGILTALEVAGLDLRQAELAVVSACETAWGEAATGEGVLGLQRAFQVSGARTAVTSLWSVDDLATRRLMERFYRNLLEGGKGKLEALREAQLWMLRQGTAELMAGADRGNEFIQDDRAAAERRLSPYYWAAFVLSGDWR